MSRTPPSVLTIAGSDSGGGAGIQADLRTFAAHHVHGLSVLTALTAQNTRGVSAIHAVPLRHVDAQLDAVFSDFRITAVKTGMLGTAALTRRVAEAMQTRRPRHLVVDPVMVASSGARLLREDAVKAVRERLLPLASLITPNVPEAEVLLGRPLADRTDMEAAAVSLHALGAGAVLLKGGHAEGRHVTDLLFDGERMLRFTQPRLRRDGHGTGCTLAAAVAARLARGESLEDAVEGAIAFVHRALAAGFRPGRGRVCVLDTTACTPA
ncbi:MAG TPA: bifunctional hydroxymethylpyrimidine kinase/phosphomethylpyrimidine kinase [Xanthomonadaceae bacterium]|nr:bifunctional hydroxymethylpyrimidine kinase/phosphomethylpyrimidine kinase [Xanthomonadaceae bacterium]